jgi:hypothetical protein
MQIQNKIMNDSHLFLTEAEVPLGSVVFLCPPGSKEPAKDKIGPLPALRKLVGGVSPLCVKLYPEDSVVTVDGGIQRSTGMRGFNPEVRFIPSVTYTLDTAPAFTKFAVFCDGQRLKYSDVPGLETYDDWIELIKDNDGKIVSCCGYAHKYYLREISLPNNVLLVATTEIGKAKY